MTGIPHEASQGQVLDIASSQGQVLDILASLVWLLALTLSVAGSVSGGTQALATNTQEGGVKYDVPYALVTVSGGADVTNTNSAYAIAQCRACTTVAVPFHLVLVVGQSKVIAPISAAGSFNHDCPACMTTALADQIVVTLKAQPSQQLLDTLNADLKQLNAVPALGAGGTPAAVASEVGRVQQEIETALQSSGLEAAPPSSRNTSTSATRTTSTSPTTTPAATTSTSTAPTTTPAPASTTPTGTSSTTTPTTPTETGTTTTETTSPTSTDTTSTAASTPSG